jgi:hypothetical protein
VGADDERAGEGGGGNEDREREQYKEKCEAFLHSSDYIRVSADVETWRARTLRGNLTQKT